MKFKKPSKMLVGPLISLISLVVFFGGFELLLSVLDYGYDGRFVRKEKAADGSAHYRENRYFTHPYFPQALIRKPQSFRINSIKGSEEIRIVVLGSSAAMGDPEASFSIARFLEVLLQEAYPEQKITVVNAAMTAVNSHVVVRVAEDCAADLDPDWFIVYEGNNEVIGPFGPSGVLSGFAQSRVAIDANVAIRKTRIGQLLNHILASLRAQESEKNWAGMEMFLEREISRSDPRLAVVTEHFESNLSRIVEVGSRRGVQSILCTVLTNQRDFPPFASQQVVQDSDLIESAKMAYHQGDLDTAIRRYQSAFLDSGATHAELAFMIGRLLLQKKAYTDAGKYLLEALELDTLRFRTDSSLNQTVRGVAQAHSEAVLLDLEAQFAAVSPDGLLGDEWLYEHVHLKPYANYQVANLLFQKIVREGVALSKFDEPKAQIMDFDTASKRLGYTHFEQALICGELVERFKRSPFKEQDINAFRLNLWIEEFNQINRKLLGNEARAQAIEIYESALAKQPGDWILLRNYGMALLTMEHWQDAFTNLHQSYQIIGDDPDTLFGLVVACEHLGKGPETRQFIDQLKSLEPNYPGLDSYSK